MAYIEGILTKGPYLPYVSMAGRALLAGYHRFMDLPCQPHLKNLRKTLFLIKKNGYVFPSFWTFIVWIQGEDNWAHGIWFLVLLPEKLQNIWPDKVPKIYFLWDLHEQKSIMFWIWLESFWCKHLITGHRHGALYLNKLIFHQIWTAVMP